MSEPIVLQILDKILGFLTVTIAAILLYKQNKAQKSQVKFTETVDKYHEEVNGKMTKFIDTTEKLAKAEQKAEDNINGSIKHLEDRLTKKPSPKKKKK